MLDVAPEAVLLDVNAAVACRVLRSGHVPAVFFRWLAHPIRERQLPDRYQSPAVSEALHTLVGPLLADASPREQREAKQAAEWLAGICLVSVDPRVCRVHELTMRMLASSLLPLYRTLATGKLQDGFQETRHRLCECLVVLGWFEAVFGSDLLAGGGHDASVAPVTRHELDQLLDGMHANSTSPADYLQQHFDLDVRQISRHVRRYARDFDPATGEFSQAALEAIAQETTAPTTNTQGTSATKKSSTAEWAEPELLWRLAGELVARKSELVLPRSWINVPVPWASIGDHWNLLHRLLQGVAADQPMGEIPVMADLPTTHAVEPDDQADEILCSDAVSDEPPAPSADGHSSSATAATDAADDELDAAEQTPSTGLTEPAAETTEAPELASRVVEKQPRSAAPLRAAQTKVDDVAESASPKVLIVEIRSHNDPVFSQILTRQLATCRNEERSVCLVFTVVQPEDGAQQQHHLFDIRENGLTTWQQKLVNWLSEHPHVFEPYAFLTADGELILSMLDLERNEVSSIIRQGLFEVLTGRAADDVSVASLAKAHIPARFHVGIATTSSPGSTFSAEQLIEPAVRCLSAARRHGKASIKSIEVF